MECKNIFNHDFDQFGWLLKNKTIKIFICYQIIGCQYYSTTLHDTTVQYKYYSCLLPGHKTDSIQGQTQLKFIHYLY